MSKFDIQRALDHLGRSVSLYRTLVEGFMEKYSDIDKKIEGALRENRIEEARRLVHSMKGLSGNLGAMTLQKKAQSFESVIKAYLKEGTDTTYIIDETNEERWGFSKELKITLTYLRAMSNMKDQEIMHIHKREDMDSFVDKKVYPWENEQLYIEKSGSNSIERLMSALSRYNYEAIKKLLAEVKQNEQESKTLNTDQWQKILALVEDFEYDRAREELLEGLEDER